MTYKQNIRAILDTNLSEIKDEIKDTIVECILLLKTHDDEIAKMRDMVKQKNCAPCCYYNNCMCKKKCRRVTDMEDCEYWW